MKKIYVAIGRFEDSQNITCVVNMNDTKKAFQHDLYGNAFKAFVVITESKLDEIKAAGDGCGVFEIIRKLTNNYYRWNDIVDYLDQCMDIIDSKIRAARKYEQEAC